MSFFSKGSHGRGRNRGRGWNNFGKRGNERPRFSIHFDVDPQKLNQLLQTNFFNLLGQGAFHPHPIPKRPPYQPLPGILNVRVPPHVSLQPEVLVNNGWEDIVQHHVVHHDD
jgi:hypothetical protein